VEVVEAGLALRLGGLEADEEVVAGGVQEQLGHLGSLRSLTEVHHLLPAPPSPLPVYPDQAPVGEGHHYVGVGDHQVGERVRGGELNPALGKYGRFFQQFLVDELSGGARHPDPSTSLTQQKS